MEGRPEMRYFPAMRNFLLCRLCALVWFLAATVALPVLHAQSDARVNGERLLEHMSAMGGIGKDPAGGYGRVAYSDADRQGREYIVGLMSKAGLRTTIDPAGNISGRR